MNNLFIHGKVIELINGKLAINPVIPLGIMIIICIVALLFKRRGLLAYLRQIVIILLLFALNLRIMIPGESAPIKQESLGANVLFVIDDTISMVAEDYNGNGRRLDAVKADCEYIIDSLPGARFAIITYNNSSQVMSPFNDDPVYSKSIIESVNPLMELYARGTTINICKQDMDTMLKLASEEGENSVILFFISDGEITSNEKLESFKDTGKYVDGGAVLGYGTAEGGRMKVLNYSDEWEEVMDERDWSDYKPAVSCIDEDNLKSIASDTGVKYVHMTDQHKIDSVLEDIKKNSTTKTVEKKDKVYKETYYWFALPISFMLILEFILLKRKR